MWWPSLTRMSIDVVFPALATEPSAPSVSPEQLKAIAELIKVVGASPEGRSAISAEYLKAIAELVSAIAWPTALVICAILFRKQLSEFFGGVQTVKVFGAELSRQITSELQVSEKEAQSQTTRSMAPTQGELARANVVERILSNADLSFVERQAGELAAEYERVRGSMRPSDERTRRMEVVVSKMRTLGRAAYPLRHELAGSRSPGKRLVAIATLQVEPDYDMLDWLAERLSVETPFISYHALVAMSVAIRAPNAADNILSIKSALDKLKGAKALLEGDSDRMSVLREIEAAAGRLKV
jgi:hypothetical protein